MKNIIPRAVLLLILLTAGTASAGILNVPGDFDQIHDAVQACAPGDTVLVAAGTFNDCTHETEGPGSTPACVIMKTGVTLIGAGVDATIIDAQGLGRGIFVELVANCRIENLQVKGAFADFYGAGILVREVGNTVTLTDLKILENLDGGIILINNSNPILTRVDCFDNVAKTGGGISIEDGSSPEVHDCLIQGNEAPQAGGIFIRNASNPLISGCTIDSNEVNSAGNNGGGIAVADESAPIIEHCTITNNVTLGIGGGISFSFCGGVLRDSHIEGNDAAGDFNAGGGIAIDSSDTLVERVTIIGNTCSGFQAEGGGMSIRFEDASPTVRRCTFVGNSTPTGDFGGAITVQFNATPEISNCIIASSTGGQAIYCAFGGAPVVTGCDIWNNAGGDAICGTDGGCNFSADPMFCGNPGTEYRLADGSPCLPGNHPDGGGCGTEVCGALPGGCDITPVDETPAKPAFTLGNRPNPFNPRTVIFFVLPEPGPVTVRIFDLRGQAVRTFRYPDLPADRMHEVIWDGLDESRRAVPSGVYQYRLESRSITQTRSMSLIR